MTRTIKAREIKEGMTVQLQVGAGIVHEELGRVVIFQEDARSVRLSGSFEVEVLSEPQPDEPAPGSVVQTGRDTFCRTGAGNCGWQLVNGTGVPWTWSEILRLADDPPEVVFSPTGN